MISVAEAEQIIMAHLTDYGYGELPFMDAVGYELAAPLYADRDFPPFDRVTMDGIAIAFRTYEQGQRSFHIVATQAAGDTPIEMEDGECIEIMTGAAMPSSADTIIRYEDLTISNGIATLCDTTFKKGQNIHRKGKDRKAGEEILASGVKVTPAVVSIAATLGNTVLRVKKTPRVTIIATGDELVSPDQQPGPYQIRISNSYNIQASLLHWHIQSTVLHIPDDPQATTNVLERCIAANDIIIMSGGVSKGKFDYLPGVLEELQVKKLFHGVAQRPGKPFWFGVHAGGCHVFAFPGNPVSTFLCLNRYFIPWLEASLKLGTGTDYRPEEHWAILDCAITFAPRLTYFAQVHLASNKQAQTIATPVEGNGSGDFANLLDTNAFIELPAEQTTFNKGDVYRAWRFK